MNIQDNNYQKKILFPFLTIFIFLIFFFRLYILKYECIISPDSCYYISLGKNFAEGELSKAFHPYWGPLYPITIGIFILFGFNPITAGFLVNIISTTLCGIIIYFFCLRFLNNKKIALFSLLIYYMHPLVHWYSHKALSEPLYSLILCVAILFYIYGFKYNYLWYFIFSGIFLGLSYNCRPEGLLYIFPLCIIYLCKKKGRNYFAIASFIITCVLISTPYIWYLYNKLGTFTLSEKIFNISWNIAKTRQVEISSIPRVILTHKHTAINLYIYHLKLIFTKYIFKLIPIYLIIPFFWGIWGARIYYPVSWVFLVILIFSILIYIIAFPKERHFFVLVPFISILGGIGLENIIRFWPSGLKVAVIILIGAGIIFSIKTATYPIRRTTKDYYYEAKLAGIWIKRDWKKRRKPIICAGDPRVWFYSGGEEFMFSNKNISPDYIVILKSKTRLKDFYKKVKQRFLENTKIWKCVKIVDNYGKKAFIYKKF